MMSVQRRFFIRSWFAQAIWWALSVGFYPKLVRTSHLMSAQRGFLSEAGSHNRFDGALGRPPLNGVGILGRVGIFTVLRDGARRGRALECWTLNPKPRLSGWTWTEKRGQPQSRHKVWFRRPQKKNLQVQAHKKKGKKKSSMTTSGKEEGQLLGGNVQIGWCRQLRWESRTFFSCTLIRSQSIRDQSTSVEL